MEKGVDLHRDAHPMRQTFVRALTVAVEKLAHAADGQSVFASDMELRACVALARLAPALLSNFPPRTSGSKFRDCNPRPDEPWTPDRLRLLADLHEGRSGDAHAPPEVVVGYLEEADDA